MVIRFDSDGEEHKYGVSSWHKIIAIEGPRGGAFGHSAHPQVCDTCYTLVRVGYSAAIVRLQRGYSAGTVPVKCGYSAGTVQVQFPYSAGTVRLQCGCTRLSTRIRFHPQQSAIELACNRMWPPVTASV